jgi:hypothetical protein
MSKTGERWTAGEERGRAAVAAALERGRAAAAAALERGRPCELLLRRWRGGSWRPCYFVFRSQLRYFVFR